MSWFLAGCNAPRVSPGPPITAAQIAGPAEAWLAPTAMIDADHPSVVATVDRIRRSIASAPASTASPNDRRLAVALHDFVRDEIRFGWAAPFHDMRASEVLEAGVGFCQTKSTLLAALLRAAGIPARVHFVDLDARVLAGILDPGTAYVDHAFLEVWLDGRWVATDAFIVDRPLYDAARAKLTASDAPLGWGIHAGGTIEWDGREDAFVQFVDDGSVPGLARRDHGVLADAGALHRDVAVNTRRGLFLRLAGPMRFRSINQTLDAWRQTP